jgi:hypothetical protein
MAKEYKVAGMTGSAISLASARLTYTSMSGDKQRKWDDKPGFFILKGIPPRGQ